MITINPNDKDQNKNILTTKFNNLNLQHEVIFYKSF